MNATRFSPWCRREESGRNGALRPHESGRGGGYEVQADPGDKQVLGGRFPMPGQGAFLQKDAADLAPAGAFFLLLALQ